MKVFREFGPWPVLGFLLCFCTFCTFCAGSDPMDHNFNYDYDSYDDSSHSHSHPSSTSTPTFRSTTETDIGRNTSGPHAIVIEGNSEYRQKIECRGPHVSNLSLIYCESSIIECRKKLPCLINGTMCTSHDEISSGIDCFAGQYYYSRSQSGSGSGSEKCLSISASWPPRAGIVKCTSSFPSSPFVSPFSTGNQSNTDTMTIDYFYTGTNTKLQLLSSLEPPFKSLTKLGFGDDYLLGEEEENVGPDTFYADQEIIIQCVTSNFLVDLKSFKIEARKENGEEHKLDPVLVYKSAAYANLGYGMWYAWVQKFRVTKDIHSFSCVGRRLDNSKMVQATRIITVIDPPSRLFVESPNGSNFPVDSKIGCNLTPPPPWETAEELKTLKKKLFVLLDVSRHSDFWITSPIQFLQFQNITQGNFSCEALQSDGNPESESNSNSKGSTALTERFDYYFDIEVKRPRIEKPGGSSIVVVHGHSHRSLVCKYTGNPMPYVIWLKNGKEILYTVPATTLEVQRDFEEAVLRIDNSTGISSDSNDSDQTLVYSCVAKNHLGADRLNFIIDYGQNSACASDLRFEGENEGLLIYSMMISTLCIFNFIGMAAYFIRRKRDAQQMEVVTKRGNDDSGVHSVPFEEVLDPDFGNLGSHSQSQRQEEARNKDFSRGISNPAFLYS